jgi:hypothetical protein
MPDEASAGDLGPAPEARVREPSGPEHVSAPAERTGAIRQARVDVELEHAPLVPRDLRGEQGVVARGPGHDHLEGVTDRRHAFRSGGAGMRQQGRERIQEHKARDGLSPRFQLKGHLESDGATETVAAEEVGAIG